jgi:hypothetical protein
MLPTLLWKGGRPIREAHDVSLEHGLFFGLFIDHGLCYECLLHGYLLWTERCVLCFGCPACYWETWSCL